MLTEALRVFTCSGQYKLFKNLNIDIFWKIKLLFSHWLNNAPNETVYEENSEIFCVLRHANANGDYVLNKQSQIQQKLLHLFWNFIYY